MAALTHLEHIEDVILTGDREASSHIPHILARVALNSPTTTVRHKVDGSPALLLGSSPHINDGRFFVTTKWDGCPFASTPADVVSSNIDPGLKSKLLGVIGHLQDSALSGVYHADLLFTPTQKEVSDSGVVFTPNTITYTIPSESPLYFEAKTKPVGLCIHSRYVSSSDGLEYDPFTMVDIHGVSRGLRAACVVDNKWMGHFEGTESFNATLNEWQGYADRAFSLIHNKVPEQLLALVQIYVNSVYRSAEGVPSWDVNSLRSFLDIRCDKEVDVRRTEKGKTRVLNTYGEFYQYIDDNSDGLEFLFMLYSFTVLLKNKLLRGVGPISGIDQAIDSIVTELGEGIVITDSLTKTVVKAVPRDTFSRANFRKVR